MDSTVKKLLPLVIIVILIQAFRESISLSSFISPIAFVGRISQEHQNTFGQNRSDPRVGWEENEISLASQGKVWKARKRRVLRYVGRDTKNVTEKRNISPSKCERWAVITTIFEPTEVCRQLSSLDEWCLVVVGDMKTNHRTWRSFVRTSQNVHYLSPTDQDALGYKISSHLNWNHFGRKNIGYLFAIEKGAQYIWDTDDDNQLNDVGLLVELLRNAKDVSDTVPLNTNKHHLLNPYHLFNPVQMTSAREEETCWPRGFPLEYVRDLQTRSNNTDGTVKLSQIGVFQSLANNDPDVDGIYRLTKETPLSFISRNKTYAVNRRQFSPFNAQATLWTRKSFWGMILPVTVHGRVSDIWRAYISECLMAYTGHHVAFTSPIVTQFRNKHSLIADVQAEIPLYTQADEFIKFLTTWDPKKGTEPELAAYMQQLVNDLYEIGIIEEKDVLLYDAWLEDLASFGYDHPSIEASSGKKNDKSGEPRRISEAKTERTPNVAVCMSGQIRTLTMAPSDPEHPKAWEPLTGILPPANMSVAESIQRVLYPKLFNPDVFMHVQTRETEREPRANDTSVCEPLRPPGGLLKCNVPLEEEIAEVDLPMWAYFPNKKPLEHRGLLQQLKGLFDCYRMIEEHSLETGKKYDWIMRARPDNYYAKFPSLDELLLDSTEPTIWYSNQTWCCCGNEDSVGIAPARWMEEYFRRYLYFQTTKWDMWNEERQKVWWHAETFLLQHVKKYGIALKAHRDMVTCAVKPRYRTERSQP